MNDRKFGTENIEIYDNSPKEGGSKPTTAGVQYGYSLTDIKVLDKRIELRFDKPETNNYITWSVWTVNYGEFKDDAAKEMFFGRLERNLVKILKIFAPDAKIEPSSLGAFIEKVVSIVSKHKNSTKVNIGLIYDKTGKYTEVCSAGIEKYTEDGKTNIRFTEWEEKNRMTKEVKKKEESRPMSSEDIPF